MASDNKAYKADLIAQRIGQKIIPGYHNFHDAPLWTEQVAAILVRLTYADVDRLHTLIVHGPSDRPPTERAQ